MNLVKALSIAVDSRTNVNIIGPPGCAKTAMVEAVARAHSRHLETLALSSREPSDFGYPVVDQKTGHLRIATHGWVRRILDAGDGIVFFDELSTAAPAVQAIALRIIFGGYVGEDKLPKTTSYVTAMNPPGQAAGGYDLSAPLANRLCHITWSLKASDWTDGMIAGFPDPSVYKLPEVWEDFEPAARAQVASFIRSKPAVLLQVPEEDSKAGGAWPSPRTWHLSSRVIAAVTALGGDPDVEAILVGGLVGEGPAMEFLTWRKNLDLPDPEEFIAKPELFEKWYGKKAPRGDVIFTLLASVAACIIQTTTRERGAAGWAIMSTAARLGAKDIAAASVRALARHKGIPTPPKDILEPFKELMKATGILPK